MKKILSLCCMAVFAFSACNINKDPNKSSNSFVPSGGGGNSGGGSSTLNPTTSISYGHDPVNVLVKLVTGEGPNPSTIEAPHFYGGAPTIYSLQPGDKGLTVDPNSGIITINSNATSSGNLPIKFTMSAGNSDNQGNNASVDFFVTFQNFSSLNVSVDPDPKDGVYPGRTSTITITNNNTQNAAVYNIGTLAFYLNNKLLNEDDDDFPKSSDNGCIGQLNPGSSCIIHIQFSDKSVAGDSIVASLNAGLVGGGLQTVQKSYKIKPIPNLKVTFNYGDIPSSYAETPKSPQKPLASSSPQVYKLGFYNYGKAFYDHGYFHFENNSDIDLNIDELSFAEKMFGWYWTSNNITSLGTDGAMTGSSKTNPVIRGNGPNGEDNSMGHFFSPSDSNLNGNYTMLSADDVDKFIDSKKICPVVLAHNSCDLPIKFINGVATAKRPADTVAKPMSWKDAISVFYADTLLANNIAANINAQYPNQYTLSIKKLVTSDATSHTSSPDYTDIKNIQIIAKDTLWRCPSIASVGDENAVGGYFYKQSQEIFTKPLGPGPLTPTDDISEHWSISYSYGAPNNCTEDGDCSEASNYYFYQAKVSGEGQDNGKITCNYLHQFDHRNSLTLKSKSKAHFSKSDKGRSNGWNVFVTGCYYNYNKPDDNRCVFSNTTNTPTAQTPETRTNRSPLSDFPNFDFFSNLSKIP